MMRSSSSTRALAVRWWAGDPWVGSWAPGPGQFGSINKLVRIVHDHWRFHKSKVQRLCSLFESAKSPSWGADEAQTVMVAHAPSKLKPAKSVDCGYNHDCSFRLLAKEDRIVVYFTSLEDV
ncbi:hypothetical protein NL676_022010 [Syzygium grande]|nr:hypothetical protein NL676_022010 [Syzygium grande]